METIQHTLHAPEALEVRTGRMKGEVNLRWRPVLTSKKYIIQHSADGTNDWTDAATATRPKATIGELATATRPWFRTAAVDSIGQGPWSNPIMGRVA